MFSVKETNSAEQLFLLLVEASDWQLKTVASVLDVTPEAVGNRLRATKRRQWRDSRRETFRKAQRLALYSRRWWRQRMSGIGVDPHALSVDDPAWFACHAKPRGWAVREVADAMRAEGKNLRDLAVQVELLQRVEVLIAQHLAPLQRRHNSA